MKRASPENSRSFSDYWYSYLSTTHAQAFIAWTSGILLSYPVEFISSYRFPNMPLKELLVLRLAIIVCLFAVYKMRCRSKGKAQLFWIGANFYCFAILCGLLCSLVDHHFGLPVYAAAGFVISGACTHYPLRFGKAFVFALSVSLAFSSSYLVSSNSLSHASLAVIGILIATSPFSTSFGSLRLYKSLRAAYDLNQKLRKEVRATKEAKARLSVTLDRVSETLLAVNSTGAIELANPPASEFFGLAIPKLLNLQVYELFSLQLENGEALEMELSQAWRGAFLLKLSSEKELRPVHLANNPILTEAGEYSGSVLLLQDITILKEEEERRLNQVRLESLGVLAGGIAHDFNNILTVIQGNISLVELEIEQGSPAREPLLKTDVALQKARELSSQLLTFSKGGAPLTESLALAPLLRSSVELYLSGTPIVLELELDSAIYAEIDRSQISQVFQNLAINAIQAMPDQGTLRVVLEERGDTAQVLFEDSGPGIPKSIADKIFDPYFSTKNLGSGLGLATAYSVAQRHGGELILANSSLGGAAFRLTLPLANQPSIESRKTSLSGTSPRALVMDDETSVRDVTCRILKRLSMEAAGAADGVEALEMYRQAREAEEPFQVVLVDLTVPNGMGGKEMVSKLLEMDPMAKAIVASGYSADPVMSNWEECGFVGALYKPYGVQQLKTVLDDLNLLNSH